MRGDPCPLTHEARFAVQGVATLDRAAVRRTVLERFSVGRMVDEYERIYQAMATNTPSSGIRRSLPHRGEEGMPR